MANQRTRRAVRGSQQRVITASRRSQDWADRQTPETAQGLALEAWRRYRVVEGPLQSALLTLYVFVAIVPSLIVMSEWVERRPGAFATNVDRHFHLSAASATLVNGVLIHGRAHELQTALIAIVGALAFGIGFGRVLQIVHVRAWGLTLPKRALKEVRHILVLMAVYGLLLVLILQLAELRAAGAPGWAGFAIAPLWLVPLVAFFTWAPRYLTYGLLARRDVMPSALLTAIVLIVFMLVSRYVLEWWINWYATDYGGFGVVMATFFWLAFSSSAIVWAASLAPALAQRRELRSHHDA